MNAELEASQAAVRMSVEEAVKIAKKEAIAVAREELELFKK